MFATATTESLPFLSLEVNEDYCNNDFRNFDDMFCKREIKVDKDIIVNLVVNKGALKKDLPKLLGVSSAVVARAIAKYNLSEYFRRDTYNFFLRDDFREKSTGLSLNEIVEKMVLEYKNNTAGFIFPAWEKLGMKMNRKLFLLVKEKLAEKGIVFNSYKKG